MDQELMLSCFMEHYSLYRNVLDIDGIENSFFVVSNIIL